MGMSQEINSPHFENQKPAHSSDTAKMQCAHKDSDLLELGR